MSESSQQRPTNSDDGLTVSAAELSRLYEARAREEDMRLAAELTSRRELVAFRDRLVTKLGLITDSYELGRYILREAQDALGFTHGLLATLGDDQFLEITASTEAVSPAYRTELLEEAFIVGEPLFIAANDHGLNAPGNADVPPGVTLRALPLLRSDERPLGVLLLEGEPRAGRTSWLDDFVALVTEALEDCRNYQKLEGLITDAAIAIARVHDARVPGQRGQSSRIESLALKLAQALGLGETQTKRIRLVALMHGLSAEQVTAGFLALRRGDLTGTAWAEGLASPFVGGIYASPLADFQSTLDELRYMSARWDGRGNDPPARGEEIPLGARIVSLAMNFVLLTADQAGNPPLGIAAAVKHLAKGAGTRFDPTVVHALETAFREVELEGRIGPG